MGLVRLASEETLSSFSCGRLEGLAEGQRSFGEGSAVAVKVTCGVTATELWWKGGRCCWSEVAGR